MQSFFVSSTFKDMQGERDALHRTVMPRLREQSAKNGENIQFIDLRWGISTADTDSKESTSKILSVCLQEVQNCKPYMIVLLGQRYGWIPPVDQIREAGAQMDFIPDDLNISVTELEIRFGMYMAEGQLDRCIFCLRDPLDESALTPEQKEVYLSANDEDARRMAALRQKIQSTPGVRVITYRLNCDNGHLTGYDDFSEKLYSVLESILAPRWAVRKHLSWQQQSLELCAEYYLEVRNKKDRILNQADRYYLGLVGVQACLMMLYGRTSQAMTDAGYSRMQALRYIANKEAGYFRAEARRDFTSRWHWALMLCAEGCSNTLKPGAGLESVDRAIALLEELHQAVEAKGYAVDISASRISAFLGFAKRVRDQYAQQKNQK